MKYIFCSYLFSDIEDDIKKSKNPNTVSGHKFQENVIRGLIENDVDVYVLNIPRYRHYPDYPKIFINSKFFYIDDKRLGEEIGFTNIYLIAYLSQYLNFKKQLKKILKENKDEELVLLTFNSHIEISAAIIKLKKKFPNIRTCDIVGDLHGAYGFIRDNATLKEKLVDIVGKLGDNLGKKFDFYVFLTESMKQEFNCGNDRYVVVEGIYRLEDTATKHSIDDCEKNIVYAGSLDINYDIEHLLKAFLLTKDKNYKLYIAGSGNGLGVVKRYQEMDERIIYLGILSPKDLLEYQNRATALVSPRKNNHEYVKYSFPSKTMECLALGKPYIAHKLDSEPREYGLYIQYSGESDEELALKIEEILDLPRKKREEIGQRARKFILEEKNPKIMCKRIVNLLERI